MTAVTQQVRNGAELHELLLDGIPDEGIVLADADGNVCAWNAAAERLTGIGRDSALGKSLALLHPEGERGWEAARVHLGKTDTCQWTFPLASSSGGIVRTTLVRGPGGAVAGFSAQLRDSSHAAEQSDQLNRLMGSIRDYAIVMLDKAGTVVRWSAGAEATKGWTASEIIGQSFERFYPPEDVAAGKPQRLLREAAEKGRVEDEGWRVRKDGSRFWADVVISAIRDQNGETTGFAKITRDLSARRAADEQLRVSEERFRLLVGSVRDYAIFLLDKDGRVLTWNRGAEEAKGYRAEEIIGRHVSTFYTPEAREAGRPQLLLRAATENGRVEDEGWRVRKDGTRFWADVVITALRDDSGNLVGFAKVTRDLSTRRNVEEQLRQSEERFRMLLGSVRDYAIFMLDPEGRVQTWNAGAQAINGYDAGEIIGQHFTRFYTPEDIKAGKPAALLEQAQRIGRVEDEGWRVRKDGTRFWADVVITAMRDETGALLGFAKVTRDLSERRRAEDERLRLAHAQEAVRLRDEFLSIASHELKTPLTALRLQLQSMRDRIEALDAKLAGRVDRATRSSERLADLVEALLDVSRISTGKFVLTLEPLDLQVVIHEVLERFGPQAESAGCSLVAIAPMPVVGSWDRLRLEQVLSNLVGNAIKYAAGTAIAVHLRDEGDEAVIEVRDHGPGIPEKDLPRIFGRFERAASMRHYGGLGLGLYVTREIIEAHRGSVVAQNAPGGGALFTVRLPREAKAHQLSTEGSDRGAVSGTLQ